MPLRDHFRPPLSQMRPWEDFHGNWAVEIKRQFNRRVLPPGYYAAAQVHIGSRVEIDVASFHQGNGTGSTGDAGGVALQTWAPPTATLTMPATFPDELEVQVFQTTAGPTLVAAIEFISPGNKDRPETRRAFVAKCASYLQQGIGLVIVDVVTVRHANLHDDLVTFLEHPAEFRFPAATELYAAAYRPTRRTAGDFIELWREGLAVGGRLPVMPLALRGGPTVPVDLESSYGEVLLDSRL